jgi:CHAT domain-containing protein/tetratricopeptide (TPR) repeat protein
MCRPTEAYLIGQRDEEKRPMKLGMYSGGVFLLIFGLLMGNGRTLSASDGMADSLSAVIDSLQVQARYPEAAKLADTLLAHLRADSTSRSYEIADAERLGRTLEFEAELPKSMQAELSEADRLTLRTVRAYDSRRYSDCETYARRKLEIRRRILGKEHPYVALDLLWLATALKERGRYADAYSELRESLAISRAQLGNDHPTVATVIDAIASAAKAMGNYAEAESLYRESLSARRRVLGAENRDVATSLNNLGLILKLRGNYSEAETAYREALAMRRRLLGEEHEEVAGTLNNYALLLKERGDYKSAEALCRRSLAIRCAVSGEKQEGVDTGLQSLAFVLEAAGDYAAAEPLYRESLATTTRDLGKDHPNTARALGNLARLLNARGNATEAESLQCEALRIFRMRFGQGHPDVAPALNIQAAIKMTGGDYAGAESLTREVVAILRDALGATHPSMATGLRNLATLREVQGDLAGAESLYRESLVINRASPNAEHPAVTLTLGRLARILLVHGDYAGAESVLVEAAHVFEAARLRVRIGMGRATFLKDSPYPALAAARIKLGKEPEAWTAMERTQGRALADLLLTANSRGLSAAEADSEKTLLLAVGDEERQAEAFRNAARSDSSGEVQRQMDAARARVLKAEFRWSTFEDDIAARHSVTEGQAFDLGRVQAALQPDEAIIGWLDLEQEKGQPRFPSWGYVVRHQGPVAWRKLSAGVPGETPPGDSIRRQQQGPSVVPTEDGLAEEKSPHSCLAFRFEISHPPIVAKSSAVGARAVYDERLAPLLGFLENVRRLIVIPSGEMLGIPVEALVIDGSGDLVEDRFAVSYVPSATIHTWLRQRAAERKTAERNAAGNPSCLAVGDPPVSVGQLAAMNASASPEPTAAAHPDSAHNLTFLVPPERQQALHGQEDQFVRSALAGNREVLSSLSRLPSTREEVQVVARLHGPGSRLLLGPEASEQELVRMAQAGELKQFRTIHLATHALVDDERPENSALVLSQVGLPDPYEAAVKGERIYDGLLDAKEIVREWKLDADLVTLSACETGLGQKVVGEGYVGLAHAFLQAGARSLLVSLWRVEDSSTSMLMERFYQNWRGGYTGVRGDGHAPGAPLPRVEALQEAKRWLREWKDERGGCPYQHPYYWAGFVLIGESA